MNLKILLIILTLGMLPIMAASIASLEAVGREARRNQLFSLNRSFEQSLQSVENCFARARNISTLLAVNEMVNQTLGAEKGQQGILEELAMVEALSSYVYSLEMSFEESSILFYVWGELSVAGSGRYRKLEEAEAAAWY